jgi:hypothetical protein
LAADLVVELLECREPLAVDLNRGKDRHLSPERPA